MKNKKTYENICKECNKTFIYRYDRFSEFCSLKCKKKSEIVGKIFGRYKVIDVIKNNNRYVCLCKCECGNIRKVRRNILENGSSKSCGCLQKKIISENSIINLIEKRFGRLLVIECSDRRNKKGNVIWKCKCDCGNIVYVSSKHLINGNSKSCGCLRKEMNCGENHWNWKGGFNINQYCVTWKDKEFKEYIFERDNYECKNQDCWGKSKRLTRHHIDYDKKNCNPNNIITLCNSCNVRANNNREYWRKLYEDINRK